MQAEIRVPYGPAAPGTPRISAFVTGEFVVNLADEATANAMHLTGTEIPEAESEFARFGLTPAPATLVKHPRIAEAAASLECRVERRIEFGPEREMVVGEILLIRARDGIIDPITKRISEDLYRPIGRLFAERYCTTRQRFNLPGTLPREKGYPLPCTVVEPKQPKVRTGLGFPFSTTKRSERAARIPKFPPYSSRRSAGRKSAPARPSRDGCECA